MDAALHKIQRREGAAAPAKLRPILLDGAKVARSRIEYYAPRGETGDLKRSLVAQQGNRGIVAWAAVDMKRIRKQVRYPYIVENGAPRHEIRSNRLRFYVSDGAAVFARKVTHPGFKPMYYFRDAIRSVRSAIRKQVVSRIFAVASGGA